MTLSRRVRRKLSHHHLHLIPIRPTAPFTKSRPPAIIAIILMTNQVRLNVQAEVNVDFLQQSKLKQARKKSERRLNAPSPLPLPSLSHPSISRIYVCTITYRYILIYFRRFVLVRLFS